ncbi:MAG: Hsp20/alpha crystallin family protein [Spirochaetota bacterium]
MEPTKETRERRCVSPLSTIREEEGKVVLQLEVPGVKKEDINVSIEDDQLRIHAPRREERIENGTYILRERNCGDYEKLFTIDNTIDRDNIDAKMENGILIITLQFKEEVKPRKIKIKG